MVGRDAAGTARSYVGVRRGHVAILSSSSGFAHQVFSAAADDLLMDAELTLEQARQIARLRARHPGAEVRAHERPWGVLVEVRRRGHAIALERFEYGGAVVHDAPIRHAA
jgi:hypothetical protein